MKNFGKSFINLISQLDLYGEQVTLLQKKKASYSSPVGRLCSIIIIAATLFSFISLAANMISLSNPNIVQKLVSTINPPFFPIDRQNFFFSIALADWSGNPILNTPDNVYYTASIGFANQIQKVRGGELQTDLTFQMIDLIQFNEAWVDPKFIQGISRDRLRYSYVVNSTDWNELTAGLQGIATSSNFSYISLNINICNPEKNSNCAPDIEEKLKYGFFQLITTDRLLDQSQPGDPYTIVAKQFLAPFALGSQTTVVQTYRHSYFQDEINFFYYFPRDSTYHVLTIASQVSSSQATTASLIEIDFFLDDKSEHYSRTYTTFFDILGNIGGLQQFLYFLLSLFVSPVTKQYQNLELINSVFAFNEQPNVKGSRNGSIQNRSVTGSPQKSTDKDQFKRLLKQKNRKLELTWYQILSFGLFNKRKQTMMNSGISEIEKQLDITTIITKLFELEKLKTFLLSENQLKLFEYLPKPRIDPLPQANQVVPLENNQRAAECFSQKQDFECKIQEAIEAYKILRESPNVKDQQLIGMIDEDLKELFDVNIQEGKITTRGVMTQGIKTINRNDFVVEDLNPLQDASPRDQRFPS